MAVHPDQLSLTEPEHLLADLDERRERAISSSRRTHAERRAEHLRAIQAAPRCRCPRPVLDGSRCFTCGREVAS
jgi:hypothetical protein